MRETTWARRVYDYFLKHWIFSAIILTISAHWFLLLQLGGKGLDLIEADGTLSKLGHFITWPVFILSVVFAVLKTAADKYNEEGKNRGGFILRRILDCVNSVTAKKMRRFGDYIAENHAKEGLSPFRDITKPREQITSILDNIQVALSEIFGMDRDQIGLSILFSPNGNDQWSFLEAVNTTHDLDLQTLISNPATTARQIIDGKHTAPFFPNKQTAAKEQQYVPGPKDKTFNTVGSVLCRDISLPGEDHFFRAILSITTYGKQLCEDADADARHKIENIVIPTFESRLQLELGLLYMKEQMSPKCLTCED
jgi:hypothetical protein